MADEKATPTMPPKELRQFRQGDVLIQEVTEDPRNNAYKKVERDNGRVILAYGEVTGHAHAIADPDVEMIEIGNGERFIITDKGISLRHEEHGEIMIGAGYYRVIRQQEYAPEAPRFVAD